MPKTEGVNCGILLRMICQGWLLALEGLGQSTGVWILTTTVSQWCDTNL